MQTAPKTVSRPYSSEDLLLSFLLFVERAAQFYMQFNHEGATVTQGHVIHD